MRKITAILLIASFAFACKYSTEQSETQLKEHLKKTMTEFLYSGFNNDSSTVKFSVLDVSYFAAADYYACKFKVHMHERTADSTGVMSARISKDFAKVDRRY